MAIEELHDIAEDQVNLTFLTNPVVLFVTIARFLTAVYILINPLWGLIWSIIFDFIDSFPLRYVGILREQYHIWDKNVDWIVYVAELWVGAQYGFFLPLFLLLFYRFIGHFMFLHFKRVVYYVFFPNFYEVAFMWLVIFYPQGSRVDLAFLPQWKWLIIMFLVKEIVEFVHHYAWPRMVAPKLNSSFGWKK